MKIAVLLSGGVDSSLALQLLSQSGTHSLTAFYLKIWLEDELAFLGDCPWETDLRYVRAVCDKLNVPLEVVSMQSEYRERIVEFALAELKEGRTPSPDIQCNQWIKFGEFYHKIDASFEKVASGHYAQIEEKNGTFLLKRAPDAIKDQTYFLSRLSQEQLSRALFPIGHLEKAQVRDMALSFDLPTQDRKDSQGICFLGKIKYPEFVKFHLGERDGTIVDAESDKVLGRHKGVWFYTIGQRQGLGLGNGPWFVTRKNIDTNTVYVTHKDFLKNHQHCKLSVRSLHWISSPPPDRANLQIKLRHGPELNTCQITYLAKDRIRIDMDQEDTGIAPGQSVIFYDEQYCLGSGTIE